MYEFSYSATCSQSVPSKVGKGLGLALCPGQTKTYMRHANLAKPKVTEAAILGLPVQSVKVSLMKASRNYKPDLKLLVCL